MLARLAHLIHQRRRRLLVALLPVLLVAGMLGGPLPGLLDAEDNFDDPGSEAVIAREALARATGASPAPDVVALLRPASAATEQRARAVLEADPAVATVADGARSRDGKAAYLVAAFRHDADEDAAGERLAERLNALPGVTAGGAAVTYTQVSEQVSRDLARAEMLAFPILLLLSLWVFRGLVAALLPLVVGGTSILITFLAMRAVNEAVGLSIFAINLVTGLGLGLAIDYSLFMISRFREELAQGAATGEAIARTMTTAGRTVLFSALTVAAALAALLVFPQRFLYSMGIGGLIVALSAALVSLTFLPAMLAALGPRVDALSLRRRSAARGGWYRLAQAVMRRPGRVAALTAVALVALGLPFSGIRFTGADASVLPEQHSARVVDDALRGDFDGNGTNPAYVAVRAPASARAEVAAYAQRLERLPGAEQVLAPRRAGDLWRIDVVPRGGSLDESSKELVRDIRESAAPFPVLVGGETAQFLDQESSLTGHLPLALALLATTTVVILFLMTGSVVLPLKTLVMNVLTLSAAFGVLVLVFQDGRLEGLLDYTSQGALEMTQPILLFAMAFGLSTDYGVFLLARIREARESGMEDRRAVAFGLEHTGRVVTAAALLFTVAIGAFATSEIVFIKELGIGTALAVIVDATIVRALLVPSLMALLGGWNWWAPRPLLRLHARFGLREATA